MSAKDYYKILGVSSDATDLEIRKAFHVAVRKCHPDIVGDDPDAAVRFKELTEAYGVLSDDKKRQQYDKRFSPPASVQELLLGDSATRALQARMDLPPQAPRPGIDAVVVAQVDRENDQSVGVVNVPLPEGEGDQLMEIEVPPSHREMQWGTARSLGEPGRKSGVAGDLIIIAIE